ncbi:glycosyltransferase [Candidatus Dependentiae bacterium]|nr:glycosyltransferase [Candidatus Dependentiae bacterium]
MDKLWMEHAFLTRQFIIATTAGLEDVELAAQRLLKNQDEIGDAIVPFYGKEAGKALAQLLREHISIAADIVKAANAQDTDKVNTLNTQWRANAVDIATFLNAANPYFDAKVLTAMLNEHLDLTTQELMLRLKRDWKADMANYDLIIEQIRMMGQGFADGIIKQFPNKF